MRRNVARIGVVAAIALSMSVATMTAPSTRAEDAPSLVAPARSSAGLMNYAINLSQLSDENAMARVIELLPSVGGTLLTQYPGLHTVFAQSESASFSPDLNAVLREHGIAVHSIGPTRVAAVPESERVTNQTPPAAPGSAPAAAPTGLTVPDPNVPDPFPTTNWGAEAMDARGAAEVEVPRAPVTVGVIDTGIDTEQPDLAGRVDTSRSVSCDVNGIPNVSEEALRYNDIHGTHIAGIIAANHNDIGIDGIAPDATLVSIKAVNDKGRLYPEYLVCAYDWAVNHGVDIVHNSFQMDPWRFWKADDPEQAAGLEAAVRAIYTAQERGLTVLSGAGDDGLDLDATTVDSSSPTDSTPIENRNVEGATMVPAMVGGVAMVSALEMATPGAEPLRATLKRTDTSNYGFMRVGFAAPGRDIYSTFPNLMIPSNYGYMSGTAVAAAHVSGVAALVKSTHPALVGEQITNLMRKQGAYEYGRLALPTDNNEYRGRGFLSARNAVVYDQAQPTLGMVEYRVDGGEWTNLRDEVVPAGRVSVRVSARSPLSMLSVDVAGVAQAHAPGGGGYFDEPTTVTIDDVDLASLIPEGEEYVTARVQVSALGINADRHADDDVSRSLSFTVARDPGAVPAPEPEPDPGEGSGVVPVDPVAPGIMSVPRTSAQMPQNYAVNLTPDADDATFQRALYQASLLGGMVLESYPALRTFFVQSSSAAFAMDLGFALADSGISFHSVGPTRQAPVVGNEAIVSQELEAPAYPSVEEKPPVPEGPHVGGVYPTPPDAKDWHLQAVGALDAQGVDVMRAPVTVGVMGDGVDDTVGDLSGKIDHSLSVSCNSNGMPNRDPEAWRSGRAEVGTQAAGVIAGTGEASGVSGVNPTLNVAAINVASATTGQYYPEYVVCGFVWAADHGISVTASNYLVSPWKYWMPGDPEQAAGLEAVRRGINYAASKDVVNVVDAGASGIDLNNP
uniref:S8 family serine peptidase n=1 Tax=uncultured Actinomyces sp. TaxID=249061 RepID=UPI0026715136